MRATFNTCWVCLSLLHLNLFGCASRGGSTFNMETATCWHQKSSLAQGLTYLWPTHRTGTQKDKPHLSEAVRAELKHFWRWQYLEKFWQQLRSCRNISHNKAIMAASPCSFVNWSHVKDPKNVLNGETGGYIGRYWTSARALRGFYQAKRGCRKSHQDGMGGPPFTGLSEAELSEWKKLYQERDWPCCKTGLWGLALGDVPESKSIGQVMSEWDARSKEAANPGDETRGQMGVIRWAKVKGQSQRKVRGKQKVNGWEERSG